MKKLFLTITTTLLLINPSSVKAQEYTSNEYKEYICAEYLSDAFDWAEQQQITDNIYDKKDRSFWKAFNKLVNRCKSYKQNTVKTLEKDYAKLYTEYWN